MTPTTHQVSPGENLSTIARKYGLPGWQALYFSNENADFRRTNKDPNHIKLGSSIVIPPNKAMVRQKLVERLALLHKLKTTAQEEELKLAAELKSNYAHIKSVGDNVDMAAMLANLVSGITQSTIKLANMAKLEGPALEAASKEAVKDAFLDRAKFGRDAALMAVADRRPEPGGNTVWAITKIVASAWVDMTSPSFWANTVTNLSNGMSWSEAVTTKPEDILNQALSNLRHAYDKAYADIDKHIAEVNAELAAL